MKNISLILNGVLFVAVAILYFLHFSEPKSTPEKSEDVAATNLEVEEPKDTVISEDTISLPELPVIEDVNGKIAYIDLEEFFSTYEYYKSGVRNIERDIDKKRKTLMEKQKALEEEFQKYQQAAPTLSENYRKTKEQQLVEMEQELFKLRDELQGAQAKDIANFNETLLKKVDDYLKDLSKKKNYNFVFTYSKGNPATIVFARDSLDITKEVVNGLNKAYRKK